ncbi:hypothetical protein MU582_10115 [Nocardioidaceae bacterium SCSIO 66511]|nr:hypothetical protein MU582_10115 [Nocardioidaceae bacterium SCSIO 66511]
MSTEQWIALLAVVVAVLALGATALLAVALRRMRADVRRIADAADASASSGPSTIPVAGQSTGAPGEVATASTSAAVTVTPIRPSTDLPVATPVPLGEQQPSDEPQIVTRDGRVVVVPSTRQVVEATMGKPMIRGAVLGHGLRYALRPESRDRLRGLIRREYRRRRKIRLRAGRRAARTASIPPRDLQSWLGTPAKSGLNVDHDGGS